ncbi:unnamed protein product, partial [Ectocarpus fasciculatus]
MKLGSRRRPTRTARQTLLVYLLEQTAQRCAGSRTYSFNPGSTCKSRSKRWLAYVPATKARAGLNQSPASFPTRTNAHGRCPSSPWHCRVSPPPLPPPPPLPRRCRQQKSDAKRASRTATA